MTFLSPNEPAPELSTTRTGGRSARLIAVAVVSVLVSVVYIGISQREPTPIQQPTQPVVAVAPTLTPTPNPTPPATEPPAVVAPREPLPDIYSGAETIAQRHGSIPSAGDLRVIIDVGGNRTEAALAQLRSGLFHAAYRVPLPAPDGRATLELFEPAPYAQAVQYGVWDVPLNMTAVGQNVDFDVGAYAPTVLVSDRQAPDPSAAPTRSVVVRNGYLLQISGSRIGNGATLNIDLEIGANPTYPNEIYNLVVQAAGHDYESHPAKLDTAPGYARGEIDVPNSTTLGSELVTMTLRARPPGGSPRSERVVETYTVPLPQMSNYKPPWFVASPVGESKRRLSIESRGYTLSITIASEGTGQKVLWTVIVKPSAANGK